MRKVAIGLSIGLIFCVITFNLVAKVWGQRSNGSTPFPNDDRTQKIYEQEHLIKEGRDLVKQGYYEDAITKFKEALRPDLLLHDYDARRPNLLIAEAFRLQGKYEAALDQLNSVADCSAASKDHLNMPSCNLKQEISALIHVRDTGSKDRVYQQVQYLSEAYAKVLPPESCPAGICDAVASHIVLLYSFIGDHDSGITFMDKFINYYAKKSGIEPEQIGPRNPYLIIKKAFEQDKAEGFKGCIEAKPGELCMGRATKALIQSDDFSW